MAADPIQQAFELALRQHQAGRLFEAEKIYRQILAAQPRHAPALHNLGLIALHSRQPAEAVKLIQAAIAIQPGWAGAVGNLANASYHLGDSLLHQGDLPGAMAAYRQAIAHRPDHADAHNNLGFALRKIGQLEEALTSIQRALQLNPEMVAAYCNLGNVYLDLGQLDLAITAYQRAQKLQPDSFDANLNLGRALTAQGEIDQAITLLGRAIATRPGSAEAHNNLGNVLGKKGNMPGAIGEYRRAIALAPHHPGYGSNLVLALEYHTQDAGAIAEAQAAWNQTHADPLRQTIQPWLNDRSPDRQLRVGYVSSDFYWHASHHFLLPLFENHDHREVEIFCYAEDPRPDEMTQRMQKPAAHWCSTVGLSDLQVADQIREDHIDILVDLKLHTANNRLPVFARKPAPVQLSWLGYPGTTGMTAIDYRLSDPYLDPPSSDQAAERIIRPSSTFWCYDPLDGQQISINPLPALQTRRITFGSLNNICKVNDETCLLWSRVLQGTPHSRLMLLCPRGEYRQAISNLFRNAGVEPDQVELLDRRPRGQYLKLYHQIDIGLDTFPYNGHTTSLDSFWMGVPVVTLVGSRPVSRGGLSQLSNLGLAELASDSPDRFVQIAIELANDLPRLANLRSTLRPRMEKSPLMDGPRFASSMEAAYRETWRRYLNTAT